MTKWVQVDERTWVETNIEVADYFDAPTLQDLRRSALQSARYYRDNYRKDGFGFERRMMRRMLEQARDYRRAERERSAP